MGLREVRKNSHILQPASYSRRGPEDPRRAACEACSPVDRHRGGWTAHFLFALHMRFSQVYVFVPWQDRRTVIQTLITGDAGAPQQQVKNVYLVAGLATPVHVCVQSLRLRLPVLARYVAQHWVLYYPHCMQAQLEVWASELCRLCWIRVKL